METRQSARRSGGAHQALRDRLQQLRGEWNAELVRERGWVWVCVCLMQLSAVSESLMWWSNRAFERTSACQSERISVARPFTRPHDAWSAIVKQGRGWD